MALVPLRKLSIESGLSQVDFIDLFIKSTSTLPTTNQFRLWSAITAISGALERRVWTRGSAGPLFPNLYTVFVGLPGSGKTIPINYVRDLWDKLKEVHIGHDNVTKAALIQSLESAQRTVVLSPTEIINFHALNVACAEFGVLFPKYDSEFLSALTHIYDGPKQYKEKRIVRGELVIDKPIITILAATQPDYLGSYMPEEAWGQGFASRLLFIFSANTTPSNVFSDGNDFSLDPRLYSILNHVVKMNGPFEWDTDARETAQEWNRANCPPEPDHFRLKHYNSRRIIHTVKLSMIACVSRSRELRVSLADFQRAQGWILEAERLMPDIFTSMIMKSDGQIFENLRIWLTRTWSSTERDKRMPIHEKEIYQWIAQRVPSHDIQRTFDAAVKMGYIRKAPMLVDYYEPALVNENALREILKMH